MGLVDVRSESESRSVVLTLWDPMDCTVHGILQARILEWVHQFPIQELNWHLLHCMQILYQLSYQGSPGL